MLRFGGTIPAGAGPGSSGGSGSGTSSPVPIYLLTGFLGSGKTTLLRRLLESPDLADTALIINELGEIGLDHRLVQSSIENVLLMEDGCLCCSVRGDLIDVIGDLFSGVRNGELPAFSRIIIETTGLADPTSIVQELATARGLSGRTRMAKVIVTVDSVLGATQLAEADEVVAQVVQADVCFVTKTDLADPARIQDLVGQLRAINPTVEIVIGGEEGAAPSLLLDLGASRRIEPQRISALRCDGGDMCTHEPGAPCREEHAFRLRSREGNIHRTVQSCSIRCETPISWPRLLDWLDLIYSNRPANMLRLKGIVHIAGNENPIAIHGVGATLSPPEVLDQPAGQQYTSEIVIITTELATDCIATLFSSVVLHGADHSIST